MPSGIHWKVRYNVTELSQGSALEFLQNFALTLFFDSTHDVMS